MYSLASRTFASRLAPTLVLALAAACGSVSNGNGDDGTGGGGTDAGPGPSTDAPRITSVTPGDGATGVGPDTDIVVSFDRPMDPASVESAWTSDDIPAAEVTFSWNQGGDVLTATPDALPLAEGDGLDPGAVPALTVTFGISTGATDAAGVALADPLSVSFATAKRMHVDVAADPELTDSRTSINGAPSAPTVVYAGDTSSDQQVKMVVTFDLPELPGGATLERAVFNAEQSNVGGSPYVDLGPLESVHVTFADLANAFSTGPLSPPPGDLSGTADLAVKTVAVTPQVIDDLMNRDSRGGHSQFRFEFETASNNDGLYDTAQFTIASLTLGLTYLAE